MPALRFRFKITFDPTLLYLTQSITGVVSDLSVVVTDDRFSPAVISLNPIINFAFDGSGTLTLSSLPGQDKDMVDTKDITIGINGWAYGPGSGAWYSQVDFGATLTTSGDVIDRRRDALAGGFAAVHRRGGPARLPRASSQSCLSRVALAAAA